MAGATRAPITAVVIIFELTGEYSIILPLMAAVAVSTGVGKLLSKDTIYTRKLTRRGVDIVSGQRHRPPTVRVADVVSSPPTTLHETATLATAAEALQRTEVGAVPVVDDSGVYRGILSAQAIADALTRGYGPTTVREMVTTCPTVTADAPLGQAMPVLDAAPAIGVPVISADGARLAGWLTHKDVLHASSPPAQSPFTLEYVRGGRLGRSSAVRGVARQSPVVAGGLAWKVTPDRDGSFRPLIEMCSRTCRCVKVCRRNHPDEPTAHGRTVWTKRSG